MAKMNSTTMLLDDTNWPGATEIIPELKRVFANYLEVRKKLGDSLEQKKIALILECLDTEGDLLRFFDDIVKVISQIKAFCAEHNLDELHYDVSVLYVDIDQWHFEFYDTRNLSELKEAKRFLCNQVWYNRHMNRRFEIEKGTHQVVSEKDYSPSRSDQTLDTVWAGALAAAKRVEDEVGVENLGPWTDLEWGMINGKLSALRWVFGYGWDILDTPYPPNSVI